MINLCLVVIANQFSETRRRETAKMKQEREDFSSESSFSSFTERFSSLKKTKCSKLKYFTAKMMRRRHQPVPRHYKPDPLLYQEALLQDEEVQTGEAK